jgi:hypothetical protein
MNYCLYGAASRAQDSRCFDRLTDRLDASVDRIDRLDTNAALYARHELDRVSRMLGPSAGTASAGVRSDSGA